MLFPLFSLSLLTSSASAAALQLPFSSSPPPPHRPDSHPSTQQQPGSSFPVDYPYRELPWGDVQVISTTDTHGWLAGHQRNEPGFSGDWGDLYSFVSRLKDEAKHRGVDLLLVDSGDRVDGNGLVDAEPAPNPKGYTALDIFSEMPYDVVTTGNHELYKDPVAAYVSTTLQEKYGERWVVSNVNLTNSDGTEKMMGNRYRKFKTEQGRKVTAFGPLFDFKAHGKTITVQSPREMIRSPWFLSALEDRPDFFLLAGHMSLRIEPDSEWSRVVEAIRERHPTTPVLVFGGHHHIRDCVQEDEYSMSLAAGRYMETVGWMSVSNLNNASSPPSFRRRYLDQNRNTYAYHAGSSFDTDKGKQITQRLEAVAAKFNLTESFGTAPQDYYLHRFPATSPNSIFHLLTTKVLPLLITRPEREEKPYTVLNTGSVRFDLFKGAFTRGDQWIMLPFTNDFNYIPSVPLSVARKLLRYLNVVGEHGLLPSQNVNSEEFVRFLSHHSSSSASFNGASREEKEDRETTLRAAADAATTEHQHRRSAYLASLSSPSSSSSSVLSPSSLNDPATIVQGGRWRTRPASEGYVTLDACGGSIASEQLGDDTAHRPFRSARQPVFVATALPDAIGEAGEKERVDVVFFDFITPDIISALNVLDTGREGEQEEGGGGRRRYGLDDVERYVEGISANTLMETYAKREWQ